MTVNKIAQEPDGFLPSRVTGAFATFRAGVRADFEFMRKARAKYLDDQISPRALPKEALKRVGLQMMISIRAMHLLRDAGFVPGAQATSRIIRYVFGAEIHWQSHWEPGINIVHGNGLVVGSGAVIGSGCVLLHNVTLGDAYDRATDSIGGPKLGENVHVGPGCALLGPITIGANSKLMAGASIDHSVPPRSLVRPAAAVVTPRGNDGV